MCSPGDFLVSLPQFIQHQLLSQIDLIKTLFIMGRDLIQELLLAKKNEQIKEVFSTLERLMQFLFVHHTSLMYSTYGKKEEDLSATQVMLGHAMDMFDGIQLQFNTPFEKKTSRADHACWAA